LSISKTALDGSASVKLNAMTRMSQNSWQDERCSTPQQTRQPAQAVPEKGDLAGAVEKARRAKKTARSCWTAGLFSDVHPYELKTRGMKS
jgi:hypothetical protein